MRPPRSTSTAYSKIFACWLATGATLCRPTVVLGFGAMRLRTLSEAECYARCYGGHSDERVTVLRPSTDRAARITPGEKVRRRFEERLDSRGPEAEAA